MTHPSFNRRHVLNVLAGGAATALWPGLTHAQATWKPMQNIN